MCQTKPERSKIQTKSALSSFTALPKHILFHQIIEGTTTWIEQLRNTEEQSKKGYHEQFIQCKCILMSFRSRNGQTSNRSNSCRSPRSLKEDMVMEFSRGIHKCRCTYFMLLCIARGKKILAFLMFRSESECLTVHTIMNSKLYHIRWGCKNSPSKRHPE